SCYDASCTPSGSGLALLRTISNHVDGTAGNGAANVEDVTVTYETDVWGQRTRETRANYDAAGTLLDQAATGWTYDTAGNQTAEVRNWASGTVTSPGDDITPSATTGARTDLTTTYSYDTAGNRIATADPRRAIEAAKGTTLGADDFIGRATFDALGQQLTERTPTTPGVSITQKTATTAYDELGGVREATDFGGLVSGTEFDRAGRAVRTFEDTASGNPDITSESTFDAAGRGTSTKDRRQVDDASLGATATAYDELGRTISVTQASGSSPDIGTITVTVYDALDRVLLENSGDGTGTAQQTTHTYDLGGRVLSTDDEFACTTQAYDWRDLAQTETSGLTGGTCAAGADTRTVTHTYDALGRLTRSEVTAGTGTGDRTLDATLDAAGRTITAATRTAGVTATTTYTLDPLDETLAEARPDGSTARTTHDPAGNAADRCYWKPGMSVGACNPVGTTPWANPPTSVTTTTYDARNNRRSLADAATNTTTVYDPDHNYQPAAFYLPTASGKEFQTLYGYDGQHRLTGITHQVCTISSGHACSSTVAAGSDTYAYDDNDNRTQVAESNGSASSDRRYCYDGLDRLRARNTGSGCTTTSGDETYTYDDAGNRLTGPGVSATYDAEGQLATCIGCGTIAHDSAGRITALAGWTYTYDAQGRLLVATETASGVRLEMTYVAEGLRTQLREITAGVLTRTRDLRYAGDAIVEETVTDAAHPSGAVVRTYTVTEAGQVVSMTIPAGEPSAGTYLVTWNGHGDALALWRQNADGTLTLANSATYGTWGTPAIATHNGIGDLDFRFLYVGAADVEWDDFSGAGLLYMHARHYHPAIGRFLQPDPSAAEANLYGYAGNSPMTKVDPSGTYQCLLGAVGGPGGLVAACTVEIIVIAGFLVIAEVNLQVQQQYWCPGGCSIRLSVPGTGTVTSIPYYRYMPRRVIFPVRSSIRGWFLAKSAQEEARRGQAPRGIERVDSPKSSVPGSQWEVHVNGGSINKDGTIKHVPRSPLTKQQKEWMRKHGWNV
ncbi:MAG: RHS repeat-associated core domain-containing protein, partial [Candidatus Limnocylindrales bacterium]